MKKLFWGLMIACLFILIGEISAQEPPPPNTDDDVIMIYYEDENPRGLASYFLINNLCLEALIPHNPDLDWTNIPYGTKLYLTTNKPCYLYSEDSIYDNWMWLNPKRLKFYENGQWLDEPYYADHVIYTYDRPNRRSQFCWDDLLGENYLLRYYLDEYLTLERNTIDVFAPPHMLPCSAKPSSTTDVGSEEQLVSHRQLDEIILVVKLSAWSPLLFSNTFNICIEELLSANRELMFHPSDYGLQFLTIRFRQADYLPCYNEQGQRLKYYDDDGQRLNIPMYSDLPVYITQSGETIEQIANRYGVCVLDLMRVNQYPSLPAATNVELFIPPSRLCPEIKVMEINGWVRRDNFIEYLIMTGTCQDKLIELNPYLSQESDFERLLIATLANKSYLLTTIEPCYQEYILHEGETIYDVERQFNVCFEELYPARSNNDVIYIPLNVQPCYNELGQRIYYYNQYQFGRYSRGIGRQYNLFIVEPEENTPSYSSMQVYSLQQTDTVYGISKQFNVCVGDLLKTNVALRLYRLQSNWIGRPIFIPQTRPCYDDKTGLPLIYEDESGNLLSEPKVSEYHIYYGAWSYMMPYYYNVCINRIEDANANKYDEQGNAQYLGYIIPTDRPPCYDENGKQLFYICYNQPMDFDTDYSYASPLVSVDINGTYCYDSADPQVVVWNQNRRVHTVVYGETLMGIARKYDVPYPLISVANNLGLHNVIFQGQQLIIPPPPQAGDIWWLAILWAFWVLCLMLFGRSIIIRIQQEKMSK
jgi:LysM repeat protein